MLKNKILILQRRPGIGDMCLFFPCINEICKHYNNYEIILLTSKRSKANELLKNYSEIKKIIFIENYKGVLGFARLFRYFTSENFTKAFIFHNSIKFFIILKLAIVKKVFFYGFFKNKKNIVIQSREFIKQSIPKKNFTFDAKIPFKFKQKKNKIKKIIIGIGGSGFSKKWNIKNYIDLITKIVKTKKKLTFVIAGGKNELKDYKIMKSKLSSKIRLLSICNLSINKSINKLAFSKLYVGNDTGFMHLAGSMRIRSFGLFGDTPTNYASYNSLIFPIIPKNFSRVSHNSKAINKISVEHVYKKIIRFI